MLTPCEYGRILKYAKIYIMKLSKDKTNMGWIEIDVRIFLIDNNVDATENQIRKLISEATTEYEEAMK